MSKSRLLILIVLLVAAGAVGYWVWRERTESPFALGEIRAGHSYKSIDAALSESARTKRTCVETAAKWQICRGPADEPKGDMTFVVNEKGRVVIVDQHVTEASAAVRELNNSLTTLWTGEAPAVAVKRPAGPDATKWVSDDDNWSAMLVPRPDTRALGEIVLTDEHTLATLGPASLPGLLGLSREGLVSGSVLDAAEKRAPGALARAADKLAAAGRPLAAAAAKLPTCGPQASLGIDAGQARRVALGFSADIVTQAVAQLHPDRRLELRDSVYLVDKDGVPELIEVTDPVAVRGGTAVAFAINWAGRANAVAQRTQTFDAPSCRAPAEIVVARLDRSKRRVVDVQSFDAEDEALASKVVDMHLLSDGAAQRLAVHTLSTYGATDWYGEVDWIDSANLDSLRMVDRRPATLAKMDTESRVAAVDLAPYAPPAGAPASLAGKRVMAIVQARGGSSAQPIVLPSPAAGPQSGWTMLTIL